MVRLFLDRGQLPLVLSRREVHRRVRLHPSSTCHDEQRHQRQHQRQRRPQEGSQSKARPLGMVLQARRFVQAWVNGGNKSDLLYSVFMFTSMQGQ